MQSAVYPASRRTNFRLSFRQGISRRLSIGLQTLSRWIRGSQKQNEIKSYHWSSACPFGCCWIVVVAAGSAAGCSGSNKCQASHTLAAKIDPGQRSKNERGDRPAIIGSWKISCLCDGQLGFDTSDRNAGDRLLGTYERDQCPLHTPVRSRLGEAAIISAKTGFTRPGSNGAGSK